MDWRAPLKQIGERIDLAKLRRDKRVLWLGGGALVLLAGFLLFGRGGEVEDPYRTQKIDRGSITRVVSATGALQPLVSVSVGSTVSGPVLSVEADFNSQVRAGQVLARLDPETFRQRVQQARAQLNQAQADAGVASTDYERYARLDRAGYASEQMMAQQRAARTRASAAVSQATAALAQAQTDLDRTVIRSPIDGVVVDRQVNPGQSVAASFQAPTLFVIAQDLSRLQANITVDEADIGDVRPAMPVRFTVDAFPDEEFEGAVSQVRQQGVDTSGVVSYTVVVQADNPGRRLLPGMTANAEIVISETPNALRLPNSALRFRPADEDLVAQGQALLSGEGGPRRNAPDAGAAIAAERGGAGGGERGMRMFEGLNLTEQQQTQVREIMQAARANRERPSEDATPAERRAAMRRSRDALMRQVEPILTPAQRTQLAALRAQRAAGGGERRAQTRAAVVWVLRDDKPTPVRIEIGEADDTYTSVVGGALREGDEVITGGGPQNDAQKQRQRGPFGGGPGGGGGGSMRIRGV